MNFPASTANSNSPSAHGEDPAGGGFNFDIVKIAMRCWWKIALPLGVMFAAGAGAAGLQFIKPMYTAGAHLLIRDRPQYLLDSKTVIEDPKKFVENQLAFLRSPVIIDPVAANPQVASAPEFVGEVSVAQKLQQRIKVTSEGRSDMFRVQFTSSSPEKAALICNEIAKGYVDFHQRYETQRGQRTVQLLEEQLAAQSNVVKTLRDNVQLLSKELTGDDPFAGKNQLKVKQNQFPIDDLQIQLVQAEVEMALLKAKLRAEEDLFATRNFAPAKSEVERLVVNSPRAEQFRATIQDLKDKMKEYAKTSNNPEKSPQYQKWQSDLATQEADLKAFLEESNAQVSGDMEKGARETRHRDLEKLKSDLASKETTVQILKDRLKEKMQTEKTYKGETLELEFTRADYERAAKVHEAISDRILSLRTEQRAPERVELFKEAVPPLAPDSNKTMLQVILLTCGGFMAPFALAVAWEHLFRRVCSREQLEGKAHVSVVAEVTEIPKRLRSRRGHSAEVSPDLQLFEESIDGLRTHLLLLQSLQGMRVLVVSSAVSGEGKTSLSSQLAVSLASASGEPTLLIDGDMRKPDIHRIFNVERGPGLAEVLKGEIDVDDAIETDFSNKLHLLTAGTLTCSPHRIMGSGEFDMLVQKLSQRYRYIVIDTPPILPASESLVMARTGDAAIMATRRDHSRVDQVKEAQSRLRAAGVKMVGAVLNGIPTRSYAYRYGSYYYGPKRYKTPRLETKSNK